MSILLVFKLTSSLLSFLLGGSFYEEILFESKESKTSTQEQVFNKVSLISTGNEDIWQMEQSHNGLDSQEWDRVLIKVNKAYKPFSVSYHQIKDGKEVEYKANCIRCHANGPRLIRPNYDSHEVQISSLNKLKILSLNLLIKSYGYVSLKQNNPFKRELRLEKHAHNIELRNIKSCNGCHYKGGPRGPLGSEHKLTIKFLTGNKLMPPWPYKLTKKDKNLLNKFYYGM